MITGKSGHKAPRGKYTAVPMVGVVWERIDLAPIV